MTVARLGKILVWAAKVAAGIVVVIGVGVILFVVIVLAWAPREDRAVTVRRECEWEFRPQGEDAVYACFLRKMLVPEADELRRKYLESSRP